MYRSKLEYLSLQFSSALVLSSQGQEHTFRVETHKRLYSGRVPPFLHILARVEVNGGTNTLAYFDLATITAKISFNVQTPGVFVFSLA